MVCGRRASPPSILYPETGHIAQETQRPTAGYLIPPGSSLSAAGPKIRGSDCPPNSYIKHSSNQNWNMKVSAMQYGLW